MSGISQCLNCGGFYYGDERDNYQTCACGQNAKDTWADGVLSMAPVYVALHNTWEEAVTHLQNATPVADDTQAIDAEATEEETINGFPKQAVATGITEAGWTVHQCADIGGKLGEPCPFCDNGYRDHAGITLERVDSTMIGCPNCRWLCIE